MTMTKLRRALVIAGTATALGLAWQTAALAGGGTNFEQNSSSAGKFGAFNSSVKSGADGHGHGGGSGVFFKQAFSQAGPAGASSNTTTSSAD
ncbi:hypothetical protein GCM10010466_41630 [Planomonospora alba]|uniref:Uncharacterized protein n=1 Tax=Planomonospora alba TaxID=161354 RepID=A0ABP6NFA1_9ACTN